MTEESISFLKSPDQQLILTTKDNPFSPKEDYEKWRIWDAEQGYFTEEYLARITDLPDDIDLDDEVSISIFTERAMKNILENDMLNIYMLV